MLESWNFLKGRTCCFFLQSSHLIQKEAHLNYKNSLDDLQYVGGRESIELCANG